VRRDEFLGWVVRNGAVIASAAQEAPDRLVPSCPESRLRDLGFHVGCVMNHWAHLVQRASLARRPLGFGMEPPPDQELEKFVRSEVEAVVDVLSTASEDTPTWNWWGEQTARWVPRVLAHETSVHGWDASNALGRPLTIDPLLAADGVVEFFDVFMPYTGKPPEDLEGRIALAASDVGSAWSVDVGPEALPTITATNELNEATVTVHAAAADLLLMLWRRLQPGGLTISGDRGFLDRFLRYPNLT
jgi:uncharacterized protein (TIGR03083 family)